MRNLVLFALSALAPACTTSLNSASRGTETTRDPPECTRGSASPVAPDARTSAGTANELTQAVGGKRTAPFVWSSLTSTGERSREAATTVTVDATSDPASARLVTQLPTRAGNGVLCEPFLELDATLHFTTADGAFSDEFSGTLQGSATAPNAAFDGTCSAAHHQGSFDLTTLQKRIANLTLALHTELLPDVSGMLWSEDSSNIDYGLVIGGWPESHPTDGGADGG